MCSQSKDGELLISVKKEIEWKCWYRIHFLSFFFVRLVTKYFSLIDPHKPWK